MKLLVATDHTFHRAPSGVIDTYCFDRGFFDDYRAVFDEVIVAARMKKTAGLANAHRSDGQGVAFVDLENVHGARWALAPMRAYCGELVAAAGNADAICVRLPAVSGVFAARLARRLDKPLMFELVGDPRLIGAFGLAGRFFGAYLAHCTRRIVRRAAVGSYVSQVHLQRAYPPGKETSTAGISSIRLPDNEILPARPSSQASRRIRIVFVASLHRYKDHPTLLEAVAGAARQGVSFEVELVGEGPMQAELENLAGSLGIRESVNFRGHVAGRPQVNAVLDRSDLFVLPSLGEGMPRALIEAMSRGLPTLGAKIPALEELLPEAQMFPAGDAAALEAKLLSIERDRSVLDAWASHSQATVRRFAQSVLSEKRRKLLTELRSRVSRDAVQ